MSPLWDVTYTVVGAVSIVSSRCQIGSDSMGFSACKSLIIVSLLGTDHSISVTIS